jgi:predicted metal-binding membrane protein
MPVQSASKLMHGRVLTVAGLTILVVLAWILLLLYSRIATGTTAMAGMAMSAEWSPAYAAAIFIMWGVMMAAMMLPSAARVILLAADLEREPPPLVAARRTGEFVAGYLAVWLVFGLVATGAQWALDEVGMLSPTMATSNWMLAGSLLLYAGVYQWDSVKEACVTHCRAPEEFLRIHWRRDGPFKTGLRHGLFCFGCCWLLMALLFVGGVMNLAWVALITVVILIEKTLSRSMWSTWAIGVILIAAGALTLVAPAFDWLTVPFPVRGAHLAVP